MFTLTLDTYGLQTVRKVIGALQSLGSKLGAVELNSVSREDSEATNAEILQWLVYTGRDFITPSADDAEEIAQAFAAELERRLGDEFSREVFGDKWDEQPSGKKQEAFASELAAAGLKQAMMAYMTQVYQRIQSQSTNNPPFESELSEAYAKHKLKTFGFEKPIGKATGQLIDNLNPDGLGSRNIRLKKQ
jgi:hypothetical protein